MKSFISTNQQLQELAQEVLENGHFDSDTDPDGKILSGLKIIRSGDVDNDEVADVFQKSNFQKGSDKWDALEDWAGRLA